MKLMSLYLYCDCEVEDHQSGVTTNWTEMALIKEDWHGEHKTLECPKCKRRVKMESSIISGEIDI